MDEINSSAPFPVPVLIVYGNQDIFNFDGQEDDAMLSLFNENNLNQSIEFNGDHEIPTIFDHPESFNLIIDFINNV